MLDHFYIYSFVKAILLSCYECSKFHIYSINFNAYYSLKERVLGPSTLGEMKHVLQETRVNF